MGTKMVQVIRNNNRMVSKTIDARLRDVRSDVARDAPDVTHPT